MFRCDMCGRPSKPGEKMLKVPHRVNLVPAGQGDPPRPQIRSELKLDPGCAKKYIEALAAEAPGTNPQSAYAALVE